MSGFRRQQSEEESGWETFAKVAVGVTAAAVGIGAIIGAVNKLSTDTQEQPHSSYTVDEPSSEDEDDNTSLQRAIGWTVAHRESMAVVSNDAFHPQISNINGLLDDIYRRYIELKDKEFDEHYTVFQTIFWRLHELMKEVDPYYKRYSSTVEFAGSHYDGLRINKPDEIDIDIVIKMPVNIHEHPVPERSDVILEHKTPGYVQLKMGKQFQNLPFRADWHINMTAYKWLDEKKYLLRSKFLYWFRSVVDRALSCFGKKQHGIYFTPVDTVMYTIRTSGSGPAVTLIIENDEGFKLNVDLVPALKFPEERWPICRGYRAIPEQCEKEYFMVVPKESKELGNRIDKDRAWRLALHVQESELMYNTNHLRQTIRFIKKLRDSQGMNQISSYFIKTLFYLEIMRLPDSTYWQNNSTTLLIMMTKKLEQALRLGEIPYFWNKDLNLLWDVNKSTLTGFANKLREFIRVLETPSQYKEVARYMLTRGEYNEYRHELEW
ncbi:cyclic GMP-AMP synthase-like receptor isoform X1 [Choristoneura fumiferana]|uniref:cyclic GMP-AMP synthase-like receptor isoform X1 n=1 Tax=Choristoneura fumiferana TaxID=7141 RepID=UPI003D15A6AF